MRRVVLALALAACEKPTTAVAPDDGAGDAKPPTEAPVCTDRKAFADLAWVPATATRLAVIDLNDSTLDPALAELSKFARASGHGLPIAAAFSMANWSIEIPLVLQTIDACGMRPGMLVHLDLGDGGVLGPTTAWIWPASCDLDRLEGELVDELGLQWLDSPGYAIARRLSGPPARFPYDLVALPGDRFALVPVDRGSWLADELRPPAPDAPPSLAVALESLEPAPVRVVLRDRGLVDPTGAPAGTDLAVRATADGAGRVEPPPKQ